MERFEGISIVQMSEIREKLGHVCNERTGAVHLYSYGKLQVNIATDSFFHAMPTRRMQRTWCFVEDRTRLI
jgi:hypothetical protein